MAEYIARNALMDHIELNAREYGEDYDAWQILGDVEDFPAADVVEVVRCGECRWYKHGRCRHPFGLRGMVSKNLHWCRYGERRNNAAD